ncbi:hypothetical protein MTR67_036483 [Solanum verrucosum]|uniref:Uncharacterized protein n=1 Tax=Solanum verrucosum TaxID=315347 RepID=A0AAF0ZMI5_SOLVR|nr:hypothetical protein MTR67_036483 [Solanum verrucosum]
MTREERITAMENQKVLNGRVFDPDILTKFGMGNLFDVVSIQGWNHLFESPVSYLHEPEVREFFYKMELLEGGGIATTVKNIETCLDEELLGIILGVPVEGIRTIEGCKPSSDFTKFATKRGNVKNAGLPIKFLKWEYQLLFEFINKVDQPPCHYGIPYGYLLNFVFNHFEVPLGRGVPGTTKQMFTTVTMLECECVEGKARGRSQVADVLEQQTALKQEVTDLTEILTNKEIEISTLKSELQNVVSRGPSTSDGNEQVLQKLKDENETVEGS